MIDAHPALKAASPQAPLVDWFLGDDVHHNGAFFLHQSFNFDADLRRAPARADHQAQPRVRPRHARRLRLLPQAGPAARADEVYFKGKRAFWNEEMDHGNYDEFWKKRALWPHFKDIKPGRA